MKTFLTGMCIVSLISLSPKFSFFNLELLLPTASNRKQKTGSLFSTKVPPSQRFFLRNSLLWLTSQESHLARLEDPHLYDS